MLIKLLTNPNSNVRDLARILIANQESLKYFLAPDLVINQKYREPISIHRPNQTFLLEFFISASAPCWIYCQIFYLVTLNEGHLIWARGAKSASEALKLLQDWQIDWGSLSLK